MYESPRRFKGKYSGDRPLELVPLEGKSSEDFFEGGKKPVEKNEPESVPEAINRRKKAVNILSDPEKVREVLRSFLEEDEPERESVVSDKEETTHEEGLIPKKTERFLTEAEKNLERVRKRSIELVEKARDNYILEYQKFLIKKDKENLLTKLRNKIDILKGHKEEIPERLRELKKVYDEVKKNACTAIFAMEKIRLREDRWLEEEERLNNLELFKQSLLSEFVISEREKLQQAEVESLGDSEKGSLLKKTIALGTVAFVAGFLGAGLLEKYQVSREDVAGKVQLEDLRRFHTINTGDNIFDILERKVPIITYDHVMERADRLALVEAVIRDIQQHPVAYGLPPSQNILNLPIGYRLDLDRINSVLERGEQSGNGLLSHYMNVFKQDREMSKATGKKGSGKTDNSGEDITPISVETILGFYTMKQGGPAELNYFIKNYLGLREMPADKIDTLAEDIIKNMKKDPERYGISLGKNIDNLKSGEKIRIDGIKDFINNGERVEPEVLATQEVVLSLNVQKVFENWKPSSSSAGSRFETHYNVGDLVEQLPNMKGLSLEDVRFLTKELMKDMREHYSIYFDEVREPTDLPSKADINLTNILKFIEENKTRLKPR